MQSPTSPISTWRPKALITPLSPAQSPLSPIVQPDETLVPFYFWNGTTWMCSFDQQAQSPHAGADSPMSQAAPFSPGSLASHRRRPLSEPHRFSLITQNCWFSEFYQTERTRGLLALLKQRGADFVCLQEVTTALLNVLLADPWIRDNYVVSDYSAKAISTYGTLILCRPDPERLRLYKLPSTMGRKLLVAEYLLDQHKLVIATVHLESMSHSAKSRRKQLDIIFNLLNAYFQPPSSLSYRALLPSPSATGSPPHKIAWAAPDTPAPQRTSSTVNPSSEMQSPSSRPPRHQARSHLQYTWNLGPDTPEVHQEHKKGFVFPSQWGGPPSSHSVHNGGRLNTSSSANSLAIMVTTPSANSTSERVEHPPSPAARPSGLAPLQSSISSDFALSPSSSKSLLPMSPGWTPAHQDIAASNSPLPKSASLDALRRVPTVDSVSSETSTASELSFPSHYQHSPSRSPAQGGDHGLFSPLRSRAPDHRGASISASFSWSSDSHNSPIHHSNSSAEAPMSASSASSASAAPLAGSASIPTLSCPIPSSSARSIPSGTATSTASGSPVRTTSFAELISTRGVHAGDSGVTLWSSHATTTIMREEREFNGPQLSPVNEDKAAISQQAQLSPITQKPVHLMIRSPSSFPMSPSSHFPTSQSQQSFPPSSEVGEQKVTVVLCGDFNMCHRSHENEAVQTSGFLDLWPHLRPSEPGWTENSDINLMRAEKKKSRKLVRFDRVLLRSEVVSSQGTVLSPSGASVSALSTQAPHPTPSDHRRTWSMETMSSSSSSHLLTVPDLASSTSAASIGPTRPCVPTSIDLFGTAPIAPSCFDAGKARDNIWLSDHFGLHAMFTLD